MRKLWIGLIGVLAVGGGVLLAARPGVQQASAATATPATAVLRVDGMTCPSCGFTVRIALKKLDGVRDAKVAQSEGRAVVEYDPARVTPQRMVETVKALGYATSLAGENGR
ncbi:MAG TPA: heavy metal-associated domain-containing protein [Gemmatimonadales bacterium]